MSVYLTIEGVTTSLNITYGSDRVPNAITIDSLQFNQNGDSTKQLISASKPISGVTPQLYDLAANPEPSPRVMTFYVVDNDTQDSITIVASDGEIKAWMISVEQLDLQRELITIEAEQISVKT